MLNLIRYLIVSLSCVLFLVPACSQDSNFDENGAEPDNKQHERISLPPDVSRLFEIPDYVQKKSDAKITERTDYWLSEVKNPGWEEPRKANRAEISTAARCIAEQEHQFRENWQRPEFELHDYSLRITEWSDGEQVGFVLGSNSIDLPLRNSMTFFFNFSSCRLIFVDYALVTIFIYENLGSRRPIGSVILHDPVSLNSKYYVNEAAQQIVWFSDEIPRKIQIAQNVLNGSCGSSLSRAVKGDRLHVLCPHLLSSELWVTNTLSSVSVLEFDERLIRQFKRKPKPQDSTKSLIGLEHTETFLDEAFVTSRNYGRGEFSIPIQKLIIQNVNRDLFE